MKNQQDSASRTCKELQREHIGQIAASLRDVQMDFQNLRAMAKAAEIPKSTLHYLMKKDVAYKNSGLSKKTVNRLRQIEASLKSKSATLTNKLQTLRASLDRYLESKRLGAYGNKVR